MIRQTGNEDGARILVEILSPPRTSCVARNLRGFKS